MKTVIFLCTICITICYTAQSQSTVDKVNDGLYKADQVKGTVDKIKGWLPKKKDKTPATASATSTNPPTSGTIATTLSNKTVTVVTIKGIDFSRLKTFTQNIQACSGVDSANMKFNSEASTIRVVHSGTTDELLKLMEQTSKDIFTENNIESFEEGSISLKL